MNKNRKFQIGDLVLVTRKAIKIDGKWEQGWCTFWIDEHMDFAIGKLFRIRNFSSDKDHEGTNSYSLDNLEIGGRQTDCIFPSFCLKLVKNVKKSKWKQVWKES